MSFATSMHQMPSITIFRWTHMTMNDIINTIKHLLVTTVVALDLLATAKSVSSSRNIVYFDVLCSCVCDIYIPLRARCDQL